MSRSHHPRPTKTAEAVLFIRVPKECRDALRRRLAEQRKRRPWEHQTMSNLVRALLMQSLQVPDAAE